MILCRREIIVFNCIRVAFGVRASAPFVEIRTIVSTSGSSVDGRCKVHITEVFLDAIWRALGKTYCRCRAEPSVGRFAGDCVTEVYITQKQSVLIYSRMLNLTLSRFEATFKSLVRTEISIKFRNFVTYSMIEAQIDNPNKATDNSSSDTHSHASDTSTEGTLAELELLHNAALSRLCLSWRGN